MSAPSREMPDLSAMLDALGPQPNPRERAEYDALEAIEFFGDVIVTKVSFDGPGDQRWQERDVVLSRRVAYDARDQEGRRVVFRRCYAWVFQRGAWVLYQAVYNDSQDQAMETHRPEIGVLAPRHVRILFAVDEGGAPRRLPPKIHVDLMRDCPDTPARFRQASRSSASRAVYDPRVVARHDAVAAPPPNGDSAASSGAGFSRGERGTW